VVRKYRRAILLTLILTLTLLNLTIWQCTVLSGELLRRKITFTLKYDGTTGQMTGQHGQ